jgi:hypothetical protein
VDARFGLFGDSANLDARYVHGLRWTFHRLKNHFGHIRWNSLWNIDLVHLETELGTEQDSCTVCVKRTIGSNIILDTPNGTPRWRGSNGSSFRSVWR